MKRAELVLVNADKMKCRKFVRASVSTSEYLKNALSRLVCARKKGWCALKKGYW